MNIVFLLYDGFTALDVAGPYEILSRLPDAKVQFVAKHKGIIESDNKFLKISADFSIDEIKEADVLIIPGSTVSFLEMVLDKTVLNWIKRVYEKSIWTASVSSGSVILAATGILDGKKITSHWYTERILENYNVTFVRKRFVKEGKIITSAGVTAGIDMAFYLAEKIAGLQFAESMQLMVEYAPEPPFESGTPDKADEDTLYFAQKRLKEDAIRLRRFSMLGI
ncbi:MAG: DJ-1/PfpI family protein [Bacteroidota bacterium]|nr:DJ-1/PfpI family protein [Bacteroidota bacterium]